MKHSEKDQTAKQIKIALAQLLRTDKNQSYRNKYNTYNHQRLSLEPISYKVHKECSLFKRKKTDYDFKQQRREGYQQLATSGQSKRKDSTSLRRSQDQVQPKPIKKKLDAMLSSIDKAEKIRVTKAKLLTTPRKLKRSNKKRILFNKKLGANWLQKSSIITQKYGGEAQSFEKSLQDKYISNRLYNMKASSDLSVDRLNKDYEQHRIIVHLRENYRVIVPSCKRRRISP